MIHDYYYNNIDKMHHDSKIRSDKCLKLWMETIIIPRGLNQCAKCGYDKCFAAIDFHHKNPNDKKYSIGNMIRNAITPDKVAEIDKVIPLCSNCHRELHNVGYLMGGESANTIQNFAHRS